MTEQNAVADEPSPIRAVLYCRSQAPPNSEWDTVDKQLAACSAACRQHGWKVVGQYHDETGGTEFRPELDRLLADAATGAFDLVIVAELSRLCPKLANLVGTISELEREGVRVVSADGSLDTASPTGRAQIRAARRACGLRTAGDA